MKIAYVYDCIYPYIIGGAEKRICELAKRLVQRGHEVTLFGMKFWEGEDIIYKEGVRLWGVCPPHERFVNGRRSIKQAIYFAWKVLPPLHKEKFDIIDCQNFPYFPCLSAKIVSLARRSPLIITWHEVWGSYWYEYLGKKGIFGKIIEKIAAHLTGNVIAVSDMTKRCLERIGVKQDIEIIPNGIDFKRIEKIRTSEEKTDIIFAGRLIKEKNVDILIKAMKLVKKEISNVKCMIIGDGPEKRVLKKLATDLEMDNNIKFTEFLENHDNVISYMKSSKVFVLPSTREGFGNVVLEANACGLPIVIVNHKKNAAYDLINNENGFICELSEEDVAEKILIAIDGRGDMERKCIESARGYDWNNTANL